MSFEWAWGRGLGARSKALAQNHSGRGAGLEPDGAGRGRIIFKFGDMKAKNFILWGVTVVIAFWAGTVWKSRGDAGDGIVREEKREAWVDTTTWRGDGDEMEEVVTGRGIYTLARAEALAQNHSGAGAGSGPRSEDLAQDQSGTGAGFETGEDSVRVEVEMVQRHYRDSLWEAWVSGPIDPRLDSVRVFAQRERVTVREIQAAPCGEKKKRWGVGPMAGVGYGGGMNGGGGWGWFVGVGVSYTLINF